MECHWLMFIIDLLPNSSIHPITGGCSVFEQGSFEFSLVFSKCLHKILSSEVYSLHTDVVSVVLSVLVNDLHH